MVNVYIIQYGENPSADKVRYTDGVGELWSVIFFMWNKTS